MALQLYVFVPNVKALVVITPNAQILTDMQASYMAFVEIL